MRHYVLKVSLLLMVILLYCCVEPFSPPEINSDEKYLVVDGFLNMGGDTTKIELRRTQNATEKASPVVELRAKLWIEGEKGEKFEFTDRGKGLYTVFPGNLNASQKYRLNIVTADGKEYLSDFVTTSKTPPIDSITYTHDKFMNAVVFKVNTHDATNNTRYYKWKFDETYEYYAPYYSSLIVKGKEVVSRQEDINHCWQYGSSSNIILGSTIKLSKDEIQQLPINIIPVASNKLLLKYSTLVKQYGLTQDAFEYWTSLSKTTQGTGSLFDPQPSQVTGNIKNKRNPKELVFGYFSATVETQKRIFVDLRLGYFEKCDVDTLPLACSTPDIECVFNTQKLLISYYGQSAILATIPSCADCRLKGGINKRPIFWE